VGNGKRSVLDCFGPNYLVIMRRFLDCCVNGTIFIYLGVVFALGIYALIRFFQE